MNCCLNVGCGVRSAVMNDGRSMSSVSIMVNRLVDRHCVMISDCMNNVLGVMSRLNNRVNVMHRFGMNSVLRMVHRFDMYSVLFSVMNRFSMSSMGWMSRVMLGLNIHV